MRSLTVWRLSVLAFALACALLAALGWMSYRRLAELREAARSVEHTLTVRSAADVLLSLIKDAETGQRGFLVTGDASYLQPYGTAVASIPERLERLRQLTIDNRSQQEHLAALDGLIRQKLDELNATIGAYRSEGPAAAARIVLGGDGKQVMDRIRTVVAAIRAEENRLLSERTAVEDRHARAATYTTVGGLGLALVLLTAATVLLSRAVRERGREQAARIAAEAVAESESRFRVTLASIGDALIATDDQGRVTLMNGVAETLTAWTRTRDITKAAFKPYLGVE
ncbi:MAG TPA: CHASE3 domain-containing protein [Methylomirabilota bacterium]|nr:CHASE3 domain-containing protein [Methylomirabilota bacterium]